MPPRNRPAALAASEISEAYEAYRAQFAEITHRAKMRFERRDWSGAQRDAADRLALYKHHVDAAVAEVRALLGAGSSDAATWAAMKDAYSVPIAGRDDSELAETFFNSVTRRVFATVGVDARIEYVRVEDGAAAASYDVHRTYLADRPTDELVRDILLGFRWSCAYAHADRDARQVAAVVDEQVRAAWGAGTLEAVEVLPTIFYRNKGAYVVGRLRRGGEVLPLLLALLNTERGIVVDAAIPTSDEASVVFGFSWSYFHVEVPRPRAVVDFLASIMPLKRVDELYTSIGFNKHGKTELYRSLLRHLTASDAKFETAEGEEGMVMSVFTLPTFNVVFKIIKDAFGFPKRTTRSAVMEKYHLVFVRDRVGRLVDAQEFEHLEFRRAAFSEPLLADLLAKAGGTVRVDGERVIVRHLYTERRVTPLNLFLKGADADAACEAVVDYGRAIKELAASNIFTGDMLLKNFGVSRHGRVICYDYDELVLLTDCEFRRIPPPADIYDEYAAEPWYHVGEHDVFPEEFASFLVPPPGPLRDAFLDAHADLLEVDWWRRAQERQRAGEVVDVFPYPEGRRLKGRG